MESGISTRKNVEIFFLIGIIVIYKHDPKIFRPVNQTLLLENSTETNWMSFRVIPYKLIKNQPDLTNNPCS